MTAGAASLAGSFALVIDGGSSGTRLRIYQWTTPSTVREFPRRAACLRRRPGLSAFVQHPELAGEQVRHLASCASKLMPPGTQSSAPLYVRATAGLRSMPVHLADAVLRAVSVELSASPFAFVDARTISGNEEAVYGWLSINHLLGSLGSARHTTQRVGWLDLGGVSAQLAFQHERGGGDGGASDTTEGGEDIEAVRLASGEHLGVFRFSHARSGRDEAFRRSCKLLLRESHAPSSRTLRRSRRLVGVEDAAAWRATASAERGGAALLEHPCLLKGDALTITPGIRPSGAVRLDHAS